MVKILCKKCRRPIKGVDTKTAESFVTNGKIYWHLNCEEAKKEYGKNK
jgi:hypothetical protein